MTTTRPLKVWDGDEWVPVGVEAPDLSNYVQTDDARLSDTRTPTDNSVTSAKIVDGAIVDGDINAAAAIAKTKVAGTAITAADTGTVTDTMLAGSITPSKVTGTALVASLADAKGDTFAATAADTVARVPGGNNGDLYVADSTATPGLKWRAPWSITASAIGVTLDRANPVYTFTSGSVTATLPTASTHTGVRFLVRNAGTGTVTVSGITGLTIPGVGYVDVVSDGSAWVVLEGAYATSTVGLASYRWNHANAAWRLIAYDSGWRDITGLIEAAFLLAVPAATLYIARLNTTVHLHYTETAAGSTATGAITLLSSLPAGFRPVASPAPRYGFPMVNVSTNAMLLDSLYLGTAGGALTTGEWVASRKSCVASWRAATDLPTSLPGTQVTAPA